MPQDKPRTFLSQSDVAIQIERLVHAIEQYDIPAFRFSNECSTLERYERTRITRYLDSIQQMMDLFDDRHHYRYSEQLQAFREACQDIRLERSPSGPVCLNEECSAYLDHQRSINVLVARIRQLTREPWYRRCKDDRRYQARQQERSVTDYVDAVLGRYSRTNIIRVDLYYRSEAQARLRIEHVFDDLSAMLAKHERNPIFDHLTGYIYALEQGEDRGYHVHAAYFFNGNEVRRDIYKAQQIGELWNRVTSGRGSYNSCNHDKERYGERCILGVVRRDDLCIRQSIHYAMRYLVKDDQLLRLKPVGARCLRHGVTSRLIT